MDTIYWREFCPSYVHSVGNRAHIFAHQLHTIMRSIVCAVPAACAKLASLRKQRRTAHGR